MSEYKPAFTVKVDDHEYSVWSDGQISGFGDGKASITVFNRIPEIIRSAANAAPERDIRMAALQLAEHMVSAKEVISFADELAQYVLTGNKPGAEG